MSDNTIHAAARAGDAHLLETLLKEGVPVDSPDIAGCTPLIRSIRAADENKSTACIKILLAAQADVNYKLTGGYTALHDAACYHNCSAVLLLIAARADVEAKTSSYETPLAKAILGFGRYTTELLLDHGASVDNIRECGTRVCIPPEWAAILVDKRKRCKDAVEALYRVLRKRHRVGGQRIPKDMVRMMANYTYNTRYNDAWAALPE